MTIPCWASWVVFSEDSAAQAEEWYWYSSLLSQEKLVSHLKKGHGPAARNQLYFSTKNLGVSRHEGRNAYSARHNYSRSGPNVRKNSRRPRPKWDWAILMHGNGRYGYHKNKSDRKSKSVNNSLQQPDLGLRWDSNPRVSRPEKTNPFPGGDFSILPSRYYYAI